MRLSGPLNSALSAARRGPGGGITRFPCGRIGLQMTLERPVRYLVDGREKGGSKLPIEPPFVVNPDGASDAGDLLEATGGLLGEFAVEPHD